MSLPGYFHVPFANFFIAMRADDSSRVRYKAFNWVYQIIVSEITTHSRILLDIRMIQTSCIILHIRVSDWQGHMSRENLYRSQVVSSIAKLTLELERKEITLFSSSRTILGHCRRTLECSKSRKSQWNMQAKDDRESPQCHTEGGIFCKKQRQRRFRSRLLPQHLDEKSLWWRSTSPWHQKLHTPLANTWGYPRIHST